MSYAGMPTDGQSQDQGSQMRMRLIQSLMQPSQPSNTGWGGLANAGSAIAGALAQRGLQNQAQQQRMSQNIIGASPQNPQNGMQIPTAVGPQQQLLSGQIQ